MSFGGGQSTQQGSMAEDTLNLGQSFMNSISQSGGSSFGSGANQSMGSSLGSSSGSSLGTSSGWSSGTNTGSSFGTNTGSSLGTTSGSTFVDKNQQGFLNQLYNDAMKTYRGQGDVEGEARALVDPLMRQGQGFMESSRASPIPPSRSPPRRRA